MPYASMSRRAYSLFRNGEVARFGYVEWLLRFTAAWTFGPEVQPLFPVPSCVLFAEVHSDATFASLPNLVTVFEGELPRRNADISEADANLVESEVPWPKAAAELDESPYRSTFRQGAILVPRRLMLVELVSTTDILPSSPEFTLVRGRTGNQDKRPWKTVEPPRGTVEEAFLYPALLGESIAPFRMLSAQMAVIPWDPERHDLMDSSMAAERGYPRLSQWLERTEALWRENGRGRRSLLDQYDYFRQLSRQFPVAPIRVAYSASGTIPAACIVRDSTAIIEHKLYWAEVGSVEEARYLSGILSSETLRAGVARYQAQGQWGARDFDKYVFNLPIPRYDDCDALHRSLAQAARTAEDVARLVPMKEGEHFRSTRKRIRAALREHGIADGLEDLVTELLS